MLTEQNELVQSFFKVAVFPVATAGFENHSSWKAGTQVLQLPHPLRRPINKELI
jgi:hypothetical protein